MRPPYDELTFDRIRARVIFGWKWPVRLKPFDASIKLINNIHASAPALVPGFTLRTFWPNRITFLGGQSVDFARS